MSKNSKPFPLNMDFRSGELNYVSSQQENVVFMKELLK